MTNMKRIREGEGTFWVFSGEVSKKLPVFYNPQMEFDRNLTIQILREMGIKRYCDALAGSGLRGIRAALEGGVSEVVLNDSNKKAVEVIGRNLEENGIQGEVYNRDVNLLLRAFRYNKFDAIDIDPFGSFIGALDSALRAIKRKHGLLCLTSTDTAALCGVSMKTCVRRYDAHPLRTAYAKEIGLRILIGACVRMSARYEMAINPIFAYNRRHYFRLFLETKAGIKSADAMLRRVSYLQHCFKCDWRGYTRINEFRRECPRCGNRLEWAGPLWDAEFASSELEVEAKRGGDELKSFVELVKREQDITTPFYEIHHLSKLHHVASPKRGDLLQWLEGRETHFSRTGVRSNRYPDLYDFYRTKS